MTDDIYQRVAKAAEYWDAARESLLMLPWGTRGRERVFARQQVYAAEKELVKALTEYDAENRAAIVNNLRYVVQAGIYNAESAYVECYNEYGQVWDGRQGRWNRAERRTLKE